MKWFDKVSQLESTVKTRLRIKKEKEPNKMQGSDDVWVGEGTKVYENAVIKNNVIIGEDCVIGNGAIIRDNVILGDNVVVGQSAEIKNSEVGSGVIVGPVAYVGDSIVRKGAMLGAMVRTSNNRLDGRDISVMRGQELVETDMAKLGCYIGNFASLGIGVIVYPGREIGRDALVEPNIVVKKNVKPEMKIGLRQEFVVEKVNMADSRREV